MFELATKRIFTAQMFQTSRPIKMKWNKLGKGVLKNKTRFGAQRRSAEVRDSFLLDKVSSHHHLFVSWESIMSFWNTVAIVSSHTQEALSCKLIPHSLLRPFFQMCVVIKLDSKEYAKTWNSQLVVQSLYNFYVLALNMIEYVQSVMGCSCLFYL